MLQSSEEIKHFFYLLTDNDGYSRWVLCSFQFPVYILHLVNIWEDVSNARRSFHNGRLRKKTKGSRDTFKDLEKKPNLRGEVGSYQFFNKNRHLACPSTFYNYKEIACWNLQRTPYNIGSYGNPYTLENRLKAIIIILFRCKYRMKI